MLTKIISGGQTGVDQGALNAALHLKINIGGFCPLGRLSENGTIPSKYPLKELNSKDYAKRTEMNVIHSDATLILCYNLPLTGGTLFTKQMTIMHKKPYKILKLKDNISKLDFYNWINEHNIKNLNIAGPRESKNPGISKDTYNFLINIFKKDC